MISTSEYRAWEAMKRRCTNTSDTRWANYGGRGITVCDRWMQSFDAFLADMGPKPVGHTGKRAIYSLDRIDVDGPYAPGNCRWADSRQQALNTRRNRVLTHAGESRTVTEWAHVIGIRLGTLLYRLNAGWTVREALAPTLIYWSRRARNRHNNKVEAA